MELRLIIDGDEVHPIAEYLDIKQLLKSLENYNNNQNKGSDVRKKIELTKNILRGIEFKGLFKMLRDIIYENNFQHVFDIHREMILISTMHFQDPYNLDIDRLQRCVIHYATPDNRIIPFCAMNNIHRETVEKKFAISNERKQTEPPQFTRKDLTKFPLIMDSSLNVENINTV